MILLFLFTFVSITDIVFLLFILDVVYYVYFNGNMYCVLFILRCFFLCLPSLLKMFLPKVLLVLCLYVIFSVFRFGMCWQTLLLGVQYTNKHIFFMSMKVLLKDIQYC